MDVEPGLRRGQPFDPSAIGDEPALVERIGAEIDRSGAMTFARFMELALYDPELGYYMRAESPVGRSGDFLTAPETHPVFGATIARVIGEAWDRLGKPEPFVIREYGPGSGALAVSILRGLDEAGSGLTGVVRYEPIEISTRRVARVRARLVEAGFERQLQPSLSPFQGVVLANEFLDALPVHRLVGTGPGFEELYVIRDGAAFSEQPGPPSTPALASRLAELATAGVVLAEGQRAEICLGVEPWLGEVSAALERGIAIVIDYMLPAAALYGPTRPDGTLRAYVGQRVHADPFRHVGRQDLTAHVDQTSLERAAESAGLDVLGTPSQAEFLVGAGLADLAEAIRRRPDATIAEALELRAALGRLLDPRATGGFRVAVLGRGMPGASPLAALQYRLPERSGAPSSDGR